MFASSFADGTYSGGNTMIKAASVQTNHIDDIQCACKDLKSQLRHKITLMKNTIGIVQCDPEYIEAGMMALLYDVSGKQVMTFPVLSQQTQVDVSRLTSGVYFLKIGNISKTIILQ